MYFLPAQDYRLSAQPQGSALCPLINEALFITARLHLDNEIGIEPPQTPSTAFFLSSCHIESTSFGFRESHCLSDTRLAP